MAISKEKRKLLLNIMKDIKELNDAKNTNTSDEDITKILKKYGIKNDVNAIYEKVGIGIEVISEFKRRDYWNSQAKNI